MAIYEFYVQKLQIYISLTLQTDDKSDIDTITRVFTKIDYK